MPRSLIHEVAPPGMASWRYGRGDEEDLDRAGAQRRVDLLAEQMKESGLDQKPVAVLAISGGGSDGAYGAGLLSGWTELGTRPEFNVVTGISTGALTAPFAFLGSEYDNRMEVCFTTLRTSDLVTERGLLEGMTSDALSDPEGLRALLETHFDEEVFRRMGEEHRRGRRLFVGTTNLDRMEPSIWCLSAIAANDVPGGLELAHDIILASASIPGVFPPVLIDVVAPDGRIYDEMHVDGGVSSQVFTFPVALRLGDLPLFNEDGVVPPEVWVIRNAPLVLKYEPTPRALFDIAGRAISGLIRSNGIGDLYRIWLTSIRDGFKFRLASIPFDFDLEPTESFDPVQMRALFERGREEILQGTAWSGYPPYLKEKDEAAFRRKFERSRSDQP